MAGPSSTPTPSKPAMPGPSGQMAAYGLSNVLDKPVGPSNLYPVLQQLVQSGSGPAEKAAGNQDTSFADALAAAFGGQSNPMDAILSLLGFVKGMQGGGGSGPSSSTTNSRQISRAALASILDRIAYPGQQYNQGFEPGGLADWITGLMNIQLPQLRFNIDPGLRNANIINADDLLTSTADTTSTTSSSGSGGTPAGDIGSTVQSALDVFGQIQKAIAANSGAAKP